jgi:hypothetical protein
MDRVLRIYFRPGCDYLGAPDSAHLGVLLEMIGCEYAGQGYDLTKEVNYLLVRPLDGEFDIEEVRSCPAVESAEPEPC